MNKDLRIQELEEKSKEKELRIAELLASNERLKSENENLKNEAHSFRELIHSSPSMITLLKGKNLVIQVANEPILKFWQKEKCILGKPLIEVHPDIRELGLEQLLHTVLESGEPQFGYEMPVYITRSDKRELSHFNFVYQPQKNRNGEVEGVAVIAQEVTPKAIYHEKIKNSEFRYRELIHSSNSLIAILKGEDMIVEIANQAIKDVWGKGDNVEGKPLFNVLPEMIGQGMPEIFDDVYKNGQPYIAQERPLLHQQNGSLKLGYFDFVYQPQKNISGEIEGVAIIAHDVTNQGLLNKKIRESEKKFRELVNFIPHKICTTTAEGEPVFYNNSWLNFTGKTSNELLKNSWYSLIYHEDREFIGELVESSMNTGQDIETELRIFDKDGIPKWHLARATAIKNEEGVINSWISSCTEIQKLKDDEKRKESFLKLVSHELKTPVTSIKGYIQLLQSILPEKVEADSRNIPVKPYLHRIESQIERLIRLISEMLDLSRIEQNELILELSDFQLNEQIETVIEDLSFSHREMQIDISHEEKISIKADKERIGQVITNLITNAVKYSPDTKKVSVRVFRTEDNQAAVSVKDYGIGIALQEQQQIFKRFYRVSGNKDETYEGFGIGLYLSNEIIEKHQGRILVKSEPGKGSEFTFKLPLNQ